MSLHKAMTTRTRKLSDILYLLQGQSFC